MMQEKICQTCLGLGSHPGENPEGYGYMSVNCESCHGSGILADYEDWEIIELNKIKQRAINDSKSTMSREELNEHHFKMHKESLVNLENQFRSNKHGFK